MPSYDDDEIVVEEEHSRPGTRAGRYRRDRQDDIRIEDFGPIGRPPPPVIKGERYPSRLGMEDDGYGDGRGAGGPSGRH